MDTWLQRGEDHRCMVISYETQLVWQFAQEIDDVLGIMPQIEMDQATTDADSVPKIIVASRVSLLRAPTPTPEQVAELTARGIADIGPSPARACKKFLTLLRNGGDPDEVRDVIERLKRAPEASGSAWSRLHKFNWKLNWLLAFDEGHRHAYHLASVGHVVDWFDQNTQSRRMGLTATPKRGDDVSIGHKMFPGIALDYPLYSPCKPCGVKDGWAVPYNQKYIEVEGVDFRSLVKMGDDFDEAELEMILGTEKMLATLVMPLLDMVGSRRTLIFSPGVEMAKNVARFINARSETICECGKRKWYPLRLIGDGATCECGRLVDPKDVTTSGEQARELDGSSPADERKHVYKDFQDGKFQFLSVCGLCREGYNNREVACVAIFRPVSKKASSLAEQMKGRACRPLRGVVDGLATKEERLAAIAASAKPNALIVDLVGITGLADCASTVQIYAEGLADQLKDEGHDEEEAARIAEEIAERAAEILAKNGILDEMPVEAAIAQAKREDDEAREKVRLEREAAEQHAREQAQRRAKAGAEVKYTEHDVGYGRGSQDYDPQSATEKQYGFAGRLGMHIKVLRSKKQLGRIIDMLLKRTPFEEVARLNRLQEDQWERRLPSEKQLGLMKYKGIPTENAKTPVDASLLIDAKLDADKFVSDRRAAMKKASNGDSLTAVALDIRLVKGVLPEPMYRELVREGIAKRVAFRPASEEPIPD
jgi:superfamily II DNA or RNA helicase